MKAYFIKYNKYYKKSKQNYSSWYVGTSFDTSLLLCLFSSSSLCFMLIFFSLLLFWNHTWITLTGSPVTSFNLFLIAVSGNLLVSKTLCRIFAWSLEILVLFLMCRSFSRLCALPSFKIVAAKIKIFVSGLVIKKFYRNKKFHYKVKVDEFIKKWIRKLED